MAKTWVRMAKNGFELIYLLLEPIDKEAERILGIKIYRRLTVRMYLSWAALVESSAMSSMPWAIVFLVAYRLVFSLDCNREAG